jgi:hypothetical protein
MPADESARARALERLNAFVGEWVEQVEVADVPSGRMTFEWALDGQFLLQRSEIPQPEFPDSLAIIAVETSGEAYTQHYFDSRGVVRVYAMSLTDGRWTLLRNSPDFTPLSFSQRFIGTFSKDGNTIAGAWESSNDDGAHWEHDFAVTYKRF